MFKVISLICALLLSFPVFAETSKKDIDCIPQELAAAQLKQANMKPIVISIEGNIVKIIVKSPDNKELILIHVYQDNNIACLIDWLRNIEVNISLEILKGA